MELEIGAIVEGKVTGLTKFGAFVQLLGGTSGLVHISEIANAYVNDVHDYLTVGQTVKVKIIGKTEAGKINLSIKQTLPAAQVQAKPAASIRQPMAPRPATSAVKPTSANVPRYAVGIGEVHGPSSDVSFEDKLKHFMQEADSKMSGNKLYADRKKQGTRKRR